MPFLGETMALGSAVLWAVGVILFKRVSNEVDPLALNFFKNSLALILYPFTLLLIGQPILADVPLKSYILLTVSGILGMGFSDTFFLMGLKKLGAGLQAIVNTIYAPTVILLSILILDERLFVFQFVGIAMILIAVLLVAVKNRSNGTITKKEFLTGFSYAILAIISMAISVIMIKQVMEISPLIWATQMRVFGGIIFILVVLLFRKNKKELLAPLLTKRVLANLVPGSFLGTYITLLLLLGSLKYALASISTVLNQTSNLFIFVLAVLILKEPSTPRRWIGIFVGVAGAILVTFGGEL